MHLFNLGKALKFFTELIEIAFLTLVLYESLFLKACPVLRSEQIIKEGLSNTDLNRVLQRKSIT